MNTVKQLTVRTHEKYLLFHALHDLPVTLRVAVSVRATVQHGEPTAELDHAWDVGLQSLLAQQGSQDPPNPSLHGSCKLQAHTEVVLPAQN